MKTITFIPLDNRPVSYDLAKDIISCTNDFKIYLPPIEIIGGLQNETDFDKLLLWLKNSIQTDYLVVALDTVAYGGLVASRRTKMSFDDVKNRLEKFKNILLAKKFKTLAFSSIMRISNNNINEEEKDYWNLYGKKIFDYSFNYHKIKENTQIPKDILEDYLATRKRNFDINKFYLDWLKQGVLQKLVFSKDDCAQYGFNVDEAKELQKIIDEQNLSAVVKTGADEIPMSLLSRIVSENKTIKIYPQFTLENSKHLISKYEDISIENSVIGQIKLAGCKVAENKENADLILYVNNFDKEQGELVMNVDTKSFNGQLPLFNKPFFFADVRFANGADNEFVKKVLNLNLKDKNYFGYSAWNTSANTLGCAIAVALIKYCSKEFNQKEFLKLQIIRFLDDWAYQANVRAQIRDDKSNLSNNKICEYMREYEKILTEKFGIEGLKVNYSFPWNRFFEIRVKVDL